MDVPGDDLDPQGGVSVTHASRIDRVEPRGRGEAARPRGARASVRPEREDDRLPRWETLTSPGLKSVKRMSAQPEKRR